jgi:hypothetical protein
MIYFGINRPTRYEKKSVQNALHDSINLAGQSPRLAAQLIVLRKYWQAWLPILAHYSDTPKEVVGLPILAAKFNVEKRYGLDCVRCSQDGSTSFGVFRLLGEEWILLDTLHSFVHPYDGIPRCKAFKKFDDFARLVLR